MLGDQRIQSCSSVVWGTSSATLSPLLMGSEHRGQAWLGRRNQAIQRIMQRKCWALQSVMGVSQTLTCWAAILVTIDANSAGQVECAFRRLIRASILRLWDFSRLHSCSAYPKGKMHLWNTNAQQNLEYQPPLEFLGWCLTQDLELFGRLMRQFILLWCFQRQLEALWCGRCKFQAGTFIYFIKTNF